MVRFLSLSARFHGFRQRLAISFSLIFERAIVRNLFLFILLANLLSWFLAIFLSKRLGSDLAVLHYNIDFGIDLVGDSWKLLALPGFLSIISLADIIFLLVFSRKQSFRFVSTFIAGSLAFICILVFLSFIALYSINF